MVLYLSLHGVKNVRRPSLYGGSTIEETKKSFWSAVTFEADLDPYDICSKSFEKVTLEVSSCEVWSFFNARISLLGGSPDQFVMIFDRCERVCISSKTS